MPFKIFCERYLQQKGRNSLAIPANFYIDGDWGDKSSTLELCLCHFHKNDFNQLSPNTMGEVSLLDGPKAMTLIEPLRV